MVQFWKSKTISQVNLKLNEYFVRLSPLRGSKKQTWVENLRYGALGWQEHTGIMTKCRDDAWHFIAGQMQWHIGVSCFHRLQRMLFWLGKLTTAYVLPGQISSSPWVNKWHSVKDKAHLLFPICRETHKLWQTQWMGFGSIIKLTTLSQVVVLIIDLIVQGIYHNETHTN